MKPPGLEPWNIGSSLTKVVHAALPRRIQGGAKPDISSRSISYYGVVPLGFRTRFIQNPLWF